MPDLSTPKTELIMLITTDALDAVSDRMYRTYATYSKNTGIPIDQILESKRPKCADIRHGVRALAMREYSFKQAEIARAETTLKDSSFYPQGISYSMVRWYKEVKPSNPKFAEMVEQLWEEAKDDE